jgi:hypothetical protein
MNDAPQTYENETKAPEMEPVAELAFGPDIDLPDGPHEAVLKSVDRFAYEDKWLLRWTFIVQTDDGPVYPEGVSSESASLKSKAATWVAAILGQGAVAPGTSWRVSDLLGKACVITTEKKEDTGFPKVVSVSPSLPSKTK